MPISSVELMRLLKATIGQAKAAEPGAGPPAWKAAEPESYFEDVDGERAGRIETLEQILAGQSSLLAALAESYDARGANARSGAVREIARFLDESADELETPAAGVRRLTGLVYPVV